MEGFVFKKGYFLQLKHVLGTSDKPRYLCYAIENRPKGYLQRHEQQQLPKF